MPPEQEKALPGELATPKIMLRRLRGGPNGWLSQSLFQGRMMTVMMLLFSQKYITTPTIN